MKYPILLTALVIILYSCQKEKIIDGGIDFEYIYPPYGSYDTLENGIIKFQLSNGFMVTMHKNKNCLSIRLPEDYYPDWYTMGGFKAGNESNLAKFMQSLFSTVNDNFDFVIIEQNQHSIYQGYNAVVYNDTKGIGMAEMDYRDIYGASSKLKSIIVNRYNNSYLLLHEIMHTWANYVVPVSCYKDSTELSYMGHWGISSAKGILGGFDINNLQEIEDNTYYVKGGFSCNGGSGRSYSSIELYLMGLVPAEEVEDITYFKNITYSYGPIFVAEDKKVVSIDDIIEEHGPRIPDYRASQKEYRALFLTFSYKELTESEFDEFSNEINEFTLKGNDSDTLNKNFWEATYGMASISPEIRSTDMKFAD